MSAFQHVLFVIVSSPGRSVQCCITRLPADFLQGFYATYDALFEKLAQQEVRAAERRGDADAKARASAAPHFGGLLWCSCATIAKA